MEDTAARPGNIPGGNLSQPGQLSEEGLEAVARSEPRRVFMLANEAWQNAKAAGVTVSDNGSPYVRDLDTIHKFIGERSDQLIRSGDGGR